MKSAIRRSRVSTNVGASAVIHKIFMDSTCFDSSSTFTSKYNAPCPSFPVFTCGENDQRPNVSSTKCAKQDELILEFGGNIPHDDRKYKGLYETYDEKILLFHLIHLSFALLPRYHNIRAQHVLP